MKYFVFLLSLMLPAAALAAGSHTPHECAHQQVPSVTYYIGSGPHYSFGYIHRTYRYNHIHTHKHYVKKIYKKKYKKKYYKRY